MTRLNIYVSTGASDSDFRDTEGLFQRLGLGFQVAADGHSVAYFADLPADKIETAQDAASLLASGTSGAVSFALL